MKQLISILFGLVMAVSAQAQIVTATVTVTNTPANGASLTIHGYTFLWTNGTPIGNFAVLITNTPGGDATNLATVATNAISQFGITVANGSSNVVLFSRAVVLNTNYTSGWGSVVLTTNGGTPPSVLVSPIAGGGMTATQQTNAISALVTDIGNLSTNPIPQTSPAASQLVGLTNDQTIAGNKTFSGSNNFEGQVTLTNELNQLAGSFTGAAVFNSLSTFEDDIVGGGADVYYQFNMEVDPGSGYFSHAKFSWDGDGNVTAKSFAGDGSGLTNINATNLTAGTIPSARLGTVINLTTQGTNSLGGIITGTVYNNSGLVNGYNADINVGTNLSIVVSGPSGSFTNVGFVAGRDQEILIFKYRGAQSMTFISQSGLESTVANRLNFGTTGTSFTQSGSPAVSCWQYDAGLSAWELLWHN